MKIRALGIVLLFSVLLSGCSETSGSNSTIEPAPSVGNPPVQDSNEVADPQVAKPAEPEVDPTQQYYLQSHAKVDYIWVENAGNDTPDDYADTAAPYETFSGDIHGNTAMQYIQSSEFINPGSSRIISWGYDENSNLVSHTEVSSFYDNSGIYKTEFNYRREYNYDDIGNCVRELRYGTVQSAPKEVIAYSNFDAFGNPLEAYSMKTILEQALVKDGENFTGADTYTRIQFAYQYDTQGRMTYREEKYRIDNGKERTDFTSYEYDDDGNLVAEINNDGNEYDAIYWEYDAQGNPVRIKTYSYGELEELSYTYDKNGQPLSLTKNGVLLETYENEYDEYGNMIRRYTYVDGVCKYYDIWDYISWEEWVPVF